MNESARMQTLIIGIGNPLRSDDGLGWAIAEQLSQDHNLDCTIRTVYQLTPEMAEWMSQASLVVLIDANREGEPGEVRLRPLSSSAQPGSVGTHYTTPEELAALTTSAYTHCPPVVVMGVTGANFALGEQLSPVIVRQLPFLLALVRLICISST